MLKALSALAITLGLIPGHALAAGAPSQFELLRDRLVNAVSTTSIVDLNQCKLESGAKTDGRKPAGGFSIDSFLMFSEPNPSIVYAHSHFTVMPDGMPVIQFNQYRVKPNDTATLTSRILSPTTYKPISDPLVFECQVGTGLRFLPKEELLTPETEKAAQGR
ncbi:VirK family protein [Brucella intermedia]|uniref:VirK family protein n=1 Tax=Brucella intermedia TaxID=94625 RepID=UPI00235F72FD|nr:VirK family protein [Brucella intermedia]